MEQHNLHLPFLDIMRNKDPETNNIRMGIFYKKTILGDVFHLTLATPNNAKTITLARRICVIVENNEVRKKRLDELQKVLYSQEYPQNLVQEAIRKVTSIPIENLSASKAKTDSYNLAFVTTFNPNIKNFFPLIEVALQSLQQSNETKECFKDIKLIKSQRQPSSLKKTFNSSYILN